MNDVQTTQTVADQIASLITRGAMFVVNHSGGKDSQAMFHMIMQMVPREQIVVIHALLPDVEWDGVEEHVRATTMGVPVHTCKSRRTLLEMIQERGMFPSPSQRQCTSDLKRGPIERTIRQAGWKLIVNCMGMRAEESSSRSKLNTFKLSERNSKNGREWYDWLPIHDWKVGEVFAKIASVGQKPHWAYEAGMSRLSCCFCLSGETEVVTRQGIKQISTLAGGEHELLIPTVTPYGLSTVGPFKSVPVLNLGEQKLLEIELSTEKRQKKTIFATAEHRWFVAINKPGRGSETSVVTKTSSELQVGGKLKSLLAIPALKIEEVPFATAQGFVFGDGTKGTGDRPAALMIYSKEKDGAMLRYFAAHRVREGANGKCLIYGLPRTWKYLPDINESRSFLLSWLAGYFAADGCVSKIGAARIDSAERSHIEFVRDILAVCGVEYGAIRKTMRIGTGTVETPIYGMNFSPDILPDWFFVNPRHLQRIQDWRKQSLGKKQAWRVVSVKDSGRSEDVYCAVVEGAEAFGLSDGIMTGNCIMSSKNDLTTAAKLNPSLYKKYVQLERSTGQVMLMPTKTKGRLTLEQVTGIYIDELAAAVQLAQVEQSPEMDVEMA